MGLVGMRESEVRERLSLGELDRTERDQARAFLERRGRFALMDASEDGKEQVFPGEPPPDIEQTHRGRDYRDGS